MDSKPLLPYNGVTFILSERSRFDTKDKLLTARAGEFFNQCLQLNNTTRLHSHIRLLEDSQPYLPDTKVVVLLGSKAQRAYIPNLSLNESRGYCYQLNGIGPVLIASYSPQDCMDRKQYEINENDTDEGDDDIEAGKEKEHSPTRRKNWKYWLAKDIAKAVRIAKEGYNPILKTAEYKTYYPSQDIINLLESYNDRTIFFDIETNKRFNITVFSFSTDARVIYTVPITRYTGDLAYDKLQTCKIFRALSTCFSRNNIVIHNSSFDLLIMAWRYKINPPSRDRIFDTMVMQHRLSPETEKSLGHCGSYLTHEEYHKNENVFNPLNIKQESQLWRYNGKDVGLLALVYEGLRKEVQRRNLEHSIQRADRLIPAYLLQTLQGINVDRDFKTKTFEELEKKKIQFLRIAKILIGYDIETLGSWQRLARYLYDFKNLPKPPPIFEADGKVKYEELTASATLYKLRAKYNVPFIDLVLHYRAIGKEAGFLKFNCWTPVKDQYKGISSPSRFTSADSITGTNTYRNASRMMFEFWGSNKQNVAKELRKVCIADLGKELVQTDQAGAEALVVAYLAPKGRYRLLFQHGIKAHTYVAMFVFQKVWEKLLKRSLKEFIESPIESLTKIEGWKELAKLIAESDEWPAAERYYYIAKMICHASNYGMRGPTFQTNVLKRSEGRIIISLDQSNYFLNCYHVLFPEIRQWHVITQHQLTVNDMTLRNLFGDERRFNGHWDDTLFKEAYAYIPQSTVGMLTNVSISELQNRIDTEDESIKEMGVDILANGHDAILSQCYKGYGGRLAKLQEEIISSHIFLQGTPNEFRMKSASTVGNNWKFKD